MSKGGGLPQAHIGPFSQESGGRRGKDENVLPVRLLVLFVFPPLH